MFRYLIFAIAFAMLVFSAKSALDYWQYDETPVDIPSLFKQGVTPAAIEQKINESIAADKPDDARMYLQIAQTFGYPIDAQQFLPRINAIDTPLHQATRSVSDFATGFLEGGGDSAAGIAGGITSDFTVIGDVRDLYEQYKLYESGQSVNELIVTLAGVGVGLTAATVASAGSAAPAKAGSSALKLATRAGKITPNFQKALIKQGSQVFDYKAFLWSAKGERDLDKLRQAAIRAYNPNALEALSQTADQVNTIRKATSLNDTVDLLSYVDDFDDLRRVEKNSTTYGKQTKGIFRLLGRGAMGTLRVLRHSTELLLSLAAALVSGLATIFSVTTLMKRKS